MPLGIRTSVPMLLQLGTLQVDQDGDLPRKEKHLSGEQTLFINIVFKVKLKPLSDL